MHAQTATTVKVCEEARVGRSIQPSMQTANTGEEMALADTNGDDHRLYQ